MKDAGLFECCASYYIEETFEPEDWDLRFSPIKNKKLEDIKYNINLYDDDKNL